MEFESVKLEKLNEGQKSALGKAFWEIVKLYKFTNAEVELLLGKGFSRTTLSHWKKERKLPAEDNDMIMRMIHLVAIHRNLRLIFPKNNEVVYKWFKTPQIHFYEKSALNILQESGMQSLMALISIRNFLDNLRAAG